MRELGVGDLLRVWHRLGASDEAAREAVRDLLLPAFAWRPLEERASPKPAPETGPIDEASSPCQVSTASSPRDDEDLDVHEPADTSLDFNYSVTPLHHEGRSFRLPESGPGLAADQITAMDLEPLLDSAWARRVLGGLITTDAHVGGVNVPRLVRSLCEMREVRRLPRMLQATLRRGAQVLLDRHPSMMAFYSDQSALRHPIEGFGGRERTTILRCDGFPPRQVSDLSVARWRDYQPPTPGTPVLVLSDLGMTRGVFPLTPQAEAEWDAFLEPLLSGGSTVCALVPCPPDRYPRFVRERVRLVLWDLSTRPSDARRIRKGRV
ncbi:hypothetical protein predicted by Glimmer/Critica [Sorangium cellulosum So ce56]|uniref:Uncharacterized protein n=2 Tax=Sorangium cellulosum TaxID=56 RepID=A9G0U6_SORC5|nr:hypothetical protein predicted by Glimmer/Critica [Sorangium cellulosum So ce56]